MSQNEHEIRRLHEIIRKMAKAINDLNKKVDTHWNRHTETFQSGTVVSVNDSGLGQTVQVQIPGRADPITCSTAMFHGYSSSTPVGSKVVVHFQNGSTGQGVIIGSLDQASRPKNLDPGASEMYDTNGNDINMTTGKITILANNNLMIIANGAIQQNSNGTWTVVASSIEFTGDLVLNGDLTVKGKINATPGPVELNGTPYTFP